jgi:hypothetical protein
MNLEISDDAIAKDARSFSDMSSKARTGGGLWEGALFLFWRGLVTNSCLPQLARLLQESVIRRPMLVTRIARQANTTTVDDEQVTCGAGQHRGVVRVQAPCRFTRPGTPPVTEASPSSNQ